MRRRALFSQVMAVNVTLICAAALAMALFAGLDIDETGRVVLVIGVAAVVGLLANLVLLRARFTPLERLIEDMERVDLSRPRANVPSSIDGRGETAEVERIEFAFLRMLRRLEAERRRSSSAALRAQEEERARVARDLHDEVNQALTGVLLRLEATRENAPPELEGELAETRSLANQAMEELLSLARQLRPTALDDLGLKAAIAGQVEELSRRDVDASFSSEGDFSDLDDDVQLVVYRVAQEALSNAARHSEAKAVDVRLNRRGAGVELKVSDNGRGFSFAAAEQGGLGISGMRERALLVDGEVEIHSRPGEGTTVWLRIEPQRELAAARSQ